MRLSAERSVPKPLYWTGWVLSVLPSLMLLMSAGMKFARPEGMDKNFEGLGWDIKLALALGIVELASTVLYLVPKTAVLGAILLTGYLGGAIATHVRIDDPFWIPLALGVAIWLGLYLRDPRLSELIPLRQ